MSEDEARCEIAKLIKTAIKIGDVSLEFAQVEGGVEINSVGEDGVGVGHNYPESIGMPLFLFVQSKRIDKGFVEIRIDSKPRRYFVDPYVYQDRPALRINLRNRVPN